LADAVDGLEKENTLFERHSDALQSRDQGLHELCVGLEVYKEDPEELKENLNAQAAAKNWPAVPDIAATLIEVDPDDPDAWIHCSEALHQLKRTSEARDILLTASLKFPAVAVIRNKLAAYGR
jgi:hypothetical protein